MRSSAKGFWLVLVALAGVGLATRAMWSEGGSAEANADLPDAWDELRARLVDFESVYAAVAMLGTPSRTLFVVRVSAGQPGAERILADRFYSAYDERFLWNGQQLWRHGFGASPPERLPALEFMVADFWAEARAGFPRTRVTRESPYPLGLKIQKWNWDWARLELPFPWASGLAVYLGFTQSDIARLNQVVIVQNSTLIAEFRISALEWDVPIEPGEFRPVRKVEPLGAIPTWNIDRTGAEPPELADRITPDRRDVISNIHPNLYEKYGIRVIKPGVACQTIYCEELLPPPEKVKLPKKPLPDPGK